MQFWRVQPPALTPGLAAQWLIAALVALGPFSLTMYQPALPWIATSLNITTAQVQLTLTVYLASFAIGQLIYGPMSESSRESGRGAPSLEREFAQAGLNAARSISYGCQRIRASHVC